MNTLGTLITLTLFGESHGSAIGAVLDGLPAGLSIDEARINAALAQRRPMGTKTDTARVEPDQYSIISGSLGGFSTGSPLTILIPNTNIRPSDYEPTKARPSHADFTANAKYHGFQDKSGGGHFSGRLTAPLVAAGAICAQALQSKGISIGTHILECAGVRDSAFASACEDGKIYYDASLREQISSLQGAAFPVLDKQAGEAMSEHIISARSELDSVGGVLQTAIVGLPVGVGEPWFDSLEGAIARAVFAIGGVKGIEFGSGFGLAKMRGSEANDPFRADCGRVFTTSNHSGGINGGLSNGMPVLFQTAVRPTPSIARAQESVDLASGENAVIEIKGRHDPAIVRRICIVLSSVVALVLCDMLAQQYGRDWLAGR